MEKLEETFGTTHYPDVVSRETLALQVDLKEERVEVSNRKYLDGSLKKTLNICLRNTNYISNSLCFIACIIAIYLYNIYLILFEVYITQNVNICIHS